MLYRSGVRVLPVYSRDAQRQNQRRVFMRPLDLLVVRRRRLIEQPFCLRNYSSRKLDIQRYSHSLEQFETPRPRLMIGCT